MATTMAARVAAQGWNRMRAALLVAVLVLPGVLTACTGVGRTADGLVYVDMTEDELQAALAANFPLRECTLGVACARFSEPRLQLSEGANRVHFSSLLHVELGGFRIPGRIALSGTPRYDPASASVFLSDLRIEHVSMAGLPADIEHVLRERGGPLLQPTFDRRAVYRVTGDGLRESLMRRNLRGVSVVNGKLRATFALTPAGPAPPATRRRTGQG